MKFSRLFISCLAPLILSGCDLNSFLPSSSENLVGQTNNGVSNQGSSEGKENENLNQNESKPGTSENTEHSSEESTTSNEENNENNTTTENTENNENNENNQTVTPVDPDPVTPVTPVDPTPENTEEDDPDGTILRMYFSESYYSVQTTKYFYVTVEIDYAGEYDWESCGDEIEWSIKDNSIATINENGKVVGQKKGSTIIQAHLKNNDLYAEVKLFVINSASDIEKSWKKMGAGDQIEEKDTIIIACPQEGKAATSEYVGHKLHSTNVTFSSDKSEITNPTGAAQFYVYSDYKNRGGYNVELLDGDKGQFLHASNTENVWLYSTAKASSSRWNINWDNENSCWDMRPATNVDGWMMYNKDIQQFANYQSNETARMFVVTLYRLTYTFKV